MLSDDGDSVKCHLCRKDITSFNEIRRLQHINRCLDSDKQHTTFKRKVDEYNSTVDCPLCQAPLAPGPFRISHLKKCSTENNVPVRDVLQLLKTQEQVTRVKKEKRLPHTKLTPPSLKSCAPKKRRNDLLPKSLETEQVHLAVSLSLSEASNKIACSQGAQPSSSSSKTLESFLGLKPKLIKLESSTDEDRLHVLQERLLNIVSVLVLKTSSATEGDQRIHWWKQSSIASSLISEFTGTSGTDSVDMQIRRSDPEINTDKKEDDSVIEEQYSFADVPCCSASLSSNNDSPPRRSTTPDLFGDDCTATAEVTRDDEKSFTSIRRSKDISLSPPAKSRSLSSSCHDLKDESTDKEAEYAPHPFCDDDLEFANLIGPDTEEEEEQQHCCCTDPFYSADRTVVVQDDDRSDNIITMPLSQRIRRLNARPTCDEHKEDIFADNNFDHGVASRESIEQALRGFAEDDSFLATTSQPNDALNEKTERKRVSPAKRKCERNATAPTNVWTPTHGTFQVLKRINVTPAPDYRNFSSPDLEKELDRYGLKSMAKRSAIPMLMKLYDETHPYLDSDGKLHVKSSEIYRKPPKKKAATKRRISSSQPATSAAVRTDNKKSNKQKVAPLSQKDSRSDPDNDDDSDHEENAEESFIPAEAEEDNVPNVDDLLRKFFIDDLDLYTKILSYEPLPLKETHSSVKSAGIKCSLNYFTNFLDNQCITFTMKDERKNPGVRHRSPKRKP